MRLQIKTILIAFLITFSHSYAYSAQEIKGYEGPISKEELRAHFKEGRFVQNRIVNGDDIIELIRDTDYYIWITDSVIVGGLDFSQLPFVTLNDLKLPKGWDKKRKEVFREVILKDKPLQNKIRLVKNQITIANSEVRSKGIRPIRVFKPDTNNMQGYDTAAFLATNTLFINYISFINTTFQGPVILGTLFPQKDFEDTIFGGIVYFDGTIFSEDAHFTKVTFSNITSFKRSRFQGMANFFSVSFNPPWDDRLFPDYNPKTNWHLAKYSEAVFMGIAHFEKASFNGITEFQKTIFTQTANFQGATFGASLAAFFIETKFGELANFTEAIFCGAVLFRNSSFSNFANFRDARFFDLLSLLHSDFNGDTSFRKTQIRWLNSNNVERPTIFKGRIDFRNSTISDAHFQDIRFEDDVDFSDVRFGHPIDGKPFCKDTVSTGEPPSRPEPRTVVFRYITFQSDAYFIRTQFTGNTAFERITFKKDADFTDAYFKENSDDNRNIFLLSYLRFNNFKITWDQLPKIQYWVSEAKVRIKSFIDISEQKEVKKGDMKQEIQENVDIEPMQPLSQVLRGLETQFLTQGQLSDANEAYYHFNVSELNQVRNERSIWQWHRLKKEIWRITWGLIPGYGTKPMRIVMWMFVFNFLFSLIYALKGRLERSPHPNASQDHTFKQRFMEWPHNYMARSALGKGKRKQQNILIDAWRFSSVVLIKIGSRDTLISGSFYGIDYKYFVWTEWIVGWYLTVALLVTLSKTWPFLHNLVSAFF